MSLYRLLVLATGFVVLVLLISNMFCGSPFIPDGDIEDVGVAETGDRIQGLVTDCIVPSTVGSAVLLVVGAGARSFLFGRSQPWSRC